MQFSYFRNLVNSHFRPNHWVEVVGPMHRWRRVRPDPFAGQLLDGGLDTFTKDPSIKQPPYPSNA
jgi:hypothetical protein